MTSNADFYNPEARLNARRQDGPPHPMNRQRHPRQQYKAPGPLAPLKHLSPGQNSHPFVQAILANPEKIAPIYGKVNAMDVGELKAALSELELNRSGSRQRCAKRLKEFAKRQRMAAILRRGMSGEPRRRWYDYFVVVDFECTCEEEVYDYFHEIIEFPAILVDAADGSVRDEFHRYVRPRLHPQLDPFCTKLTGVTQAQVDQAEFFPQTVAAFLAWLHSHEAGTTKTYALVTDGPWDFAKFFQMTCLANGLDAPPHEFRHWINLRRAFTNLYFSSSQRRMNPGAKDWKNLEGMLEALGMEFQGRPHSGIDDSRNLARIVGRILADGHELRVNERLQIRAKATRRLEARAAKEEALRRAEAALAGRSWTQTQRLREEEKERREAEMTPEDKDRQVWRDTLPYKNLPISRHQFLMDSYLECDTCSSDPQSEED